jgi:hypothetical protein
MTTHVTNVVWEFMLSHRPTLVYLQETKLSVICNPLANEMLGASFDYDYLPSLGAAGGGSIGLVSQAGRGGADGRPLVDYRGIWSAA